MPCVCLRRNVGHTPSAEQGQIIARMKRQLDQLTAENKSLQAAAAATPRGGAAADPRALELEGRLKSANAAMKREKNSVAELTVSVPQVD